MGRMREASALLPIYRVERDCILSRRGELTVAFALALPEIFTLSEGDYLAYHAAWAKAIRLLPPNVVLHKQDWFLEDRVRADYEGAGDSFLGRASERFFHERPFLSHSCYLLLTQRPMDGRVADSGSSGILRRSLVPPLLLEERLAEGFMEAVGAFVRILSDSGFVSLSRLGDDELAGTSVSPGLIERYMFLLGDGERACVGDVMLSDGVVVDGKRLEVFSLSDVQDLPGACGPHIGYDRYSTDRSRFSIGMASPLGCLLDCSHLYNQYVLVGDAQREMKRLEARKLRLQSLSGYSRENALGASAINDFLNEAVVSGRLPVKAHFNVMAWSGDAAKQAELKNLVGAGMAQLDAVCRRESDGAAQLWFAGIPGNAGDIPLNDCFDTFVEQAVCFFNLEGNYRSSVSPFGLRLGDRLSGRPVWVDISDEPMKLGLVTNRNKFILGPSGSGKSFFINHMLRSYYEQGAHIVLVDVGHSYRGLCELVGGYYFTYTEQDPIRFNPFYLARGEVLDTEKKESIKTLLLALWKREGETFTMSEYVALSAALTLYYGFLSERPEVFACFDSFYEFLLSDYRRVLEEGRVKEKDFDVDNFLYVLGPYYRGGEFDYLLNGRENLDLLEQRFIVFELDNIKDHAILFPVVTLVLMEMFVAKMRKLKGIRKVLLIEECWKAIAREGMAEYIKYVFKTVRKFFGEAIVVTQEVEDIISSPIVKQAIVGNSDCKILLDQRKYQQRFGQIQELLGLTDKEKALVLSMNRANDPDKLYKEVFISLGGQLSKVYRTEVSPSEYYAYTTEEREKLLVQSYAARYGSVQKGIARLVADLEEKNKGNGNK